MDEFTKVTGYHCKAIIRLLHGVNLPSANRKRERPRQYSAVVVGALRIAWEATDRLLYAWRQLGGQYPFSTTKPSSLLKSSISIRTFADRQ